MEAARSQVPATQLTGTGAAARTSPLPPSPDSGPTSPGRGSQALGAGAESGSPWRRSPAEVHVETPTLGAAAWGEPSSV